jgi:zinc transporter ZupT
MSLVLQTVALAFCMSLFCALPLLSAGVRRHSRALFLMGTGALLGICFFDLVPELWELGGSKSLWILAGVWLAYSMVHFFLHRDHQGPAPEGFSFFFGSLLVHCFASGMLLSVSRELPGDVGSTVFAALFVHKIYESLLLASVLLQGNRSLRRNVGLIALYALSLPAGVWTAALFEERITQPVAMLMSSIAVGTLLGCLIFDFLIPSLRQLRERRLFAGWVLLGLALTRWVMLRG